MPHVSTLFASHTVEEQPQSQEELLHMRKKTRPTLTNFRDPVYIVVYLSVHVG